MDLLKKLSMTRDSFKERKVFFNAIRKGVLREIEEMFNQGVDVNMKGICGGTSLMKASDAGHADVARYLLDKGADVNAKALLGGTSLMKASSMGHVGVMRVLLDKGAEVNAKDFFGGTSLMKASSFGHTAAMKILLESDADMNAKDRDGCTALISAASSGHVDAVRLLLDRGANVYLKTTWGDTAFKTASDKHRPEIAKILQEAMQMAPVSAVAATPMASGPIVSRKDRSVGIEQKQSAVTGALIPSAPASLCGGCGQAVLSAGKDAGFNETSKEFPYFCPFCDQWFHERCARNNFWSGPGCPSCPKKNLLRPVFFCRTCDTEVTVRAGSLWPDFQCATCSRPVSMMAFEKVGSNETFLCVLIGIVSLAGLIWSYEAAVPAVIKVMAWIIAVPLALPWLANGLASMLAGMTRTTLNIKAPAEGGLRLQTAEAREFRQKPMKHRLFRIYFFYACHAIYAMFFCALAMGFIFWVTSVAHSR